MMEVVFQNVKFFFTLFTKAIYCLLTFVSRIDFKPIKVIILINQHIQLLILCGYTLLFVRTAQSLSREGCRILLRYRVVPFEVYQQEKFQEDQGVLEMKALLRGEDFPVPEESSSRNQMRPVLPENFNPFREFCMASIHYRSTYLISKMYSSLRHGKQSLTAIENYYYGFLEELVQYVTSFIAVNRRS